MRDVGGATTPQRQAGGRAGIGVFALLLVTVAIGALLWSDPVLLYLTVSFALVAGVFASSQRPGGRDWFEPINVVGFSLAYSIGLRAVYMVTTTSDRQDFLTLGLGVEEILTWIPLIGGSVLALVVGYRLTRRLRVADRVVRNMSNRTLSPARAVTISAALLGLSLIGVALFVATHSIRLDEGLLALSRKRSVEIGNRLGVGGYSRLLAQLSQFGFFLVACGILWGALRTNVRNRSILVLSLGGAAAVPFLASSRSTIVILGIVPLVFAYYSGRLRVRWLVTLGIVAIIIITTLGTVRSINQTGSEGYQSAVDSVLGAGNGLDAFRTAAIIDRAEERDVTLDGDSYVAFFSAPIPRSVWPEKPNPSLGPWVKSELFDFRVRTNGMPPGLVAEGYLNFGIVGSILACFVFGGLLRVFYEAFRPHLGRSFLPTFLYAVAIWRLAFGTIGLNLAQGLIQTLTLLIPAAAVGLYATRRTRVSNEAPMTPTVTSRVGAS